MIDREQQASILPDEIIAIGDFAAGPIDGIQFHLLALPDKRIPACPRFLFGRLPEELLSNFFSHWGISSMGIFTCSNVTVVGEFLLSKDGKYLRSPELNIHPAHIAQALDKYSKLSPFFVKRRLSGRNVCLAGPGYGVYGHWLVEYLPKLGLLHAAGYDLATLSYLVPTSVPKFALDWLANLGIKESQIVSYDPRKETILAEELLLPTVTHNGVRVSPLFKEAALFLKARLIAQGQARSQMSAGNKIFVSRDKASEGRRLLNRDKIEQMAVDAGFVLAYPEQLTIADQIKLFSDASQIIGEYGSALHSSMFSKPGTIICALRGNMSHPGFIQSGIGDVMDHMTGYVIGETNDSDPNAPFSVSEKAFESCLNLIFRDVPV